MEQMDERSSRRGNLAAAKRRWRDTCKVADLPLFKRERDIPFRQLCIYLALACAFDRSLGHNGRDRGEVRFTNGLQMNYAV